MDFQRNMYSKRPDARIFFLMLVLGVIAGGNSIQAQSAGPTVAVMRPPPVVNRDNSMLARRAITVLQDLADDVLPYPEFESRQRLAQVPLDRFTSKLNEATVEVESILSQMSDGKLKNHLRNSLYSYRDGAFWWARIAPQKVVTTTSLRLEFATTTPAEHFLASTLPDRVVIHWRQANKYLRRARKLVSEENIGSR